jgi:hypothetical protein
VAVVVQIWPLAILGIVGIVLVVARVVDGS